MRHRPDVQCHHQGWWSLSRRQSRGQPLGRLAQHGKGAISRGKQSGVIVERDPGLEHCGIKRRFVAREAEIGPANGFEGTHRIGAPAVPRASQQHGEPLEAAQRHFRQQRLGIAEVSIRRAGTDAGQTGRLRDGEAGGALLGDQHQRRLDQGLAQIAMMIAAAFEATVP